MTFSMVDWLIKRCRAGFDLGPPPMSSKGFESISFRFTASRKNVRAMLQRRAIVTGPSLCCLCDFGAAFESVGSPSRCRARRKSSAPPGVRLSSGRSAPNTSIRFVRTWPTNCFVFGFTSERCWMKSANAIWKRKRSCSEYCNHPAEPVPVLERSALVGSFE